MATTTTVQAEHVASWTIPTDAAILARELVGVVPDLRRTLAAIRADAPALAPDDVHALAGELVVVAGDLLTLASMVAPDPMAAAMLAELGAMPGDDVAGWPTAQAEAGRIGVHLVR